MAEALSEERRSAADRRRGDDRRRGGSNRMKALHGLEAGIPIDRRQEQRRKDQRALRWSTLFVRLGVRRES